MILKIINSKTAFCKLRLIVSALLFCAGYSYGQPSLPPRFIEVNAIQNLNFGSFVLTGSAGGSVLLGYNGIRSSTGSIALLGNDSQPAIFEVKLLQGRNVKIDFTGTYTLTGSNGGSLVLTIDTTEKGNTGTFFPTDNNRAFTTNLSVGGKLDIPGNSIPGTYIGTFNITFNQE